MNYYIVKMLFVECSGTPYEVCDVIAVHQKHTNGLSRSDTNTAKLRNFKSVAV